MRAICRALATSLQRACFSCSNGSWSFLIVVGGPDNGGMGSQGEKQTYDIGKEQHNCSKPAVWSDGVQEKVVGDCGYLVEVTSPAISIWLRVEIIYSFT
jgi:hypothetical protein